MNNDLITPLTGDGLNHIVKIICGKGNHSRSKAVLKYEIPDYLKMNRYDIYNIEDDGVVYVRLIKNDEDDYELDY